MPSPISGEPRIPNDNNSVEGWCLICDGKNLKGLRVEWYSALHLHVVRMDNP